MKKKIVSKSVPTQNFSKKTLFLCLNVYKRIVFYLRRVQMHAFLFVTRFFNLKCHPKTSFERVYFHRSECVFVELFC
jgi:hypothetical protein